MRRRVVSALAALLAGLTAPILYIVAEAVVQTEALVTDDFEFALRMVAPFTLLAAFILAWPSYSLQPERTPPLRRLLVAILICFVAGTGVMIPLAETLPWKAGLAAVLTLLSWVGYRHLGIVALGDPAKSAGAGKEGEIA